MGKNRYHIPKYVGYFCSIFGIILIFAGLAAYSLGPIECGLTSWESEESTLKYIEPFKYSSYAYKRHFPDTSLILDVQTTIMLEDAEKVKVYFMNETLYLQFENDAYSYEHIKNTEVNTSTITFQPVSDVYYYVVLYNTLNETSSIHIKIKTSYIFRNFDYEFAFKNLEISLIGGVIFAISFPFGNIIYELQSKIFSISVFPGSKSKKDKTGYISWVLLGIIALLIFYRTQELLNKVARSDLPPPIISLTQDLFIRFGLLYFSIAILIIVPTFIILDLIYKLIAKSLLWCFVTGRGHSKVNYHIINKQHTNKNLMIDAKLFEKCDQVFKQKSLSALSILIYSIIFVFGISLWHLLDILLISREVAFIVLCLPILVPLALFWSYNLAFAIREAATTESEYVQLKRYAFIEISSLLLTSPFIFVLWVKLFNLSFDFLYSVTIGLNMLTLTIPQLRDEIIKILIPEFEFLPQIVNYSSTLIVGIIFILSSFPLLNYFSDPVEVKIKKKHVFFKEILVFILSFITMEIILLALQQPLVIVTPGALATAFAYSILRNYISRLWKMVVQKPKFCQKCKKDLSDFPGDIRYCPYCNEELTIN